MYLIRTIGATVLISGTLMLFSFAARAEKPISPAKAVKQAEVELKRLIKEGDDRPSVYEARLDLVRALAGLQEPCENIDRMAQELKLIAAWTDRFQAPLRVTPQLIYNELGRAEQIRASCTDDQAQRQRHHEAAIEFFLRARESAAQDHDALNEAVTLYNASASAQSIGDMPRAVALMEQACAVDREYALNENYAEDYPELVRLKDELSGTQTAPEAIDAHLAALSEDKLQLSFKALHGDQQRYRSQMRSLTWAGGERQERTMEMLYSSSVSVNGDTVTYAMQPAQSKVNGKDAKMLAVTATNVAPEELVAHLLAQPLSYTVKTNGEFVGTTGLDEVRKVVLARVDAAIAPTAGEQRDRARKLVEQLLSEPVINQQVADEWAMAVGWWIDAQLDVGDWYSTEVEAPQPMAPGSTIRYTYNFKVNRRLACGPEDSKKSCAELIIEGKPDREQFADYLLAVVTQMVGKPPRKQARWFRERLVEDVEMVERHVIVVDPATLKTYRQLRTKRQYVPAFEKGSPPKIEIETTLSELQLPAPQLKSPPVSPARNQGRKRKV